MLPESSDELKNPYKEYYRYLKNLVFVFTKSDV